MGLIIIKNRQPSDVPTPPAGKTTLFVDPNDGSLKKKDSNGIVSAIGQGSGTGIKYFWNNQTEQDAETTQANGDRGIRLDIIGRPVYEWNGSLWFVAYLLDGDASKTEYTHSEYPSVVSVKDALDTILYTPITVVLNGGGNYEIGQAVADVNLTWSLNKTPLTQSLNQGIGSVLPGITNYDVIGANLTNDTTYTITVNDGTNGDSDSATIRFLNRVHWGVGIPDQFGDSFILGLGSSVLASSRQRSINFNIGAGQRGYYVLPVSFGTPVFAVGGFEGGFELVAQVTHINLYGYTELYNVYQTEQENLGNTTVIIT